MPILIEHYSKDQRGRVLCLYQCDKCLTKTVGFKFNFEKRKRCNVCLAIERFVEIQEKLNIKLISEIPIVGDTNKVICQWCCKNGHILDKNFNDIRGSKAFCEQCKREKDLIDYNKLLSEKEYTLLSEIPIVRKMAIKLQCKYNHIWETSYQKIKMGSGCHYCMNFWQVCPSTLTKEERELRRDRWEYRRWRRDVMAKDDFTCQKCLKLGGKLRAHHLNGYHWDRQNRFNVENGVTLCCTCHNKFHKIYGQKFNTKEQFEEYLIKYPVQTNDLLILASDMVI